MTGCPIVDCAMRHMNKTGYMPNRLRMIVSNYLVKDLLIDWKWGEKYFA
jgi:deoxyribodipyrimidine photo-lyase